jgi:hypothetical protein
VLQYVPLEEGRYSITPELARELIDENTIGVVGILGSTYNGEFEDIKGLNDMVGEWPDAVVWVQSVYTTGWGVCTLMRTCLLKLLTALASVA